MLKWSSRGRKSYSRKESKRKEDQRRERVSRKISKVREKVDKSRNAVFFQCFVAPKAQKVGSLKRQVRSHLVGWEIKNCLRLWREAHSEVKMSKTIQVRSTFGRWDVEKVRATSWREAHFEVKRPTAHQVRNTFESWDVKKMHAAAAHSTLQKQIGKDTTCSHHFLTLSCRKSACRCSVKPFRSQTVKNTPRSDHFWTLSCRKKVDR